MDENRRKLKKQFVLYFSKLFTIGDFIVDSNYDQKNVTIQLFPDLMLFKFSSR